MRLYTALILAASAQAAAAAWSIRDRQTADGRGDTPIAVTIEPMSRVEVLLHDDDSIWLNIILTGNAGDRFGASCPTVQIDRKLPVFRPSHSAECLVTPLKTSMLLGHRTPEHIRSKVVYELVNGTQIAVRYQTHEGRYVELVFPLTRSKRAVKAALGGLRIRTN